MLDLWRIRQDFPILRRKINGKELVYLDNAATTQKPRVVVEALVNYYFNHNANIHRGIHTLAEEATLMYEETREKVARFIGAKAKKEIVFVRNSTEAINLVAYSFGRKFIEKNDEIIVSEAEHHSNLVPWQILVQEKKAKLKFLRINQEGYLDLKHLESLLSKKTKLVSIVHISNVLGIINPVEKIGELAHRVGAKVLIDGSQSAPRMPINVSKLNCDFFVFTGHKMLGPTGIGVLWGKQEVLSKMSPFLGGGDMIQEVDYRFFLPNDLPYKFEAGTPHIAGVIGLGAAIDYLEKVGMKKIFFHEKKLTEYALAKLSQLSQVKIYGPLKSPQKIGLVAFNLKNIHPHDLAQFLDSQGIAIRSGHHCAMPLHRRILQISASCRASFYLYNTEEDIDRLVEGIEKAERFFYG